jgi:SAM-dependent methyltransferase
MDTRHDYQAQLNADFWASGEHVGFYAHRDLRPVELVLLRRYRGALSGTVLELGCGAGRLTGYLIEIAAKTHGIDISAAMIAHCRAAYPGGVFEIGDLRDLSRVPDQSFDAVLAPYNALDVLGDGERRRVLRDIARLLVGDGLFIMSSHNRAHAARARVRTRLLLGSPRRPVASLRRLPLRIRNRRRLMLLERDTADYALRNDEAHDFGVLHYYVTPQAQQRQLNAAGFELLECLDLKGRSIARGAQARDCPEVHYVARRCTRPGDTGTALTSAQSV